MATSGKVPPKPQLKPSVPQKQEPAPARVRPREVGKPQKSEALDKAEHMGGEAGIEPVLPDQGKGRRLPEPEPPPDLRARVGDLTLDPEGFGGLTALLAFEHLLLLTSKQHRRKARGAIIEEAGELLLSTERPDFVKKVLLRLAEEPRVIDIYPLELMAYVLERRPGFLPGISFTPFIKNRGDLEAEVFQVEEPIRLELPLSARLKAMALEGGGAPGYHLYPGALSEYFVELGEAGRYTLLLRAEVHKESLVDRVTLEILDSPSGS